MIGVIGGMGPLATVDYMAKVIEESHATQDSDHVPLLVSNDARIAPRPAAILNGGTSPLAALLAIRDRLIGAGATAIVMPCNTAHHWHAQLVSNCPVPFISIIDASCDWALEMHAKRGSSTSNRVAVLATQATLAARLYDTALIARGFSPENPTEDQLDHWVLPCIAAVKSGDLASARLLLSNVLQALAAAGVGWVLLACTELPIALTDDEPHRNLCIDTNRALARASVKHWRLNPTGAH